MSVRPPREARDRQRISMQARDEEGAVKVDRRRCAKCGAVKLAKCFYRNKWAITGLHHYCRTCEALRQKVYSKSRAAKARVEAAAKTEAPEKRLGYSVCYSDGDQPSPDAALPARLDAGGPSGAGTWREGNESAFGSRVGTVDDWLADCSPENPGVKLVKTEGAVRRRFRRVSVDALCFQEPRKPRPPEAEGEPVGPEDLFFSWNVDEPTNM